MDTCSSPAPRTDIIIPSWNQTELALDCLASIEQNTQDYRIIWVDNGSDEESFRQVYAQLASMPHKLVRNSDNLGFIRATNQGLSLSTASWVVLLNNDTEVPPSWLEALRYPFEHPEESPERPKVGAVGPLSSAKDSWQGRHKVQPGWMLLKDTTMLSFFCVMLSREVVQKVGLLNEDYGVGLGDDDEYCARIHKAGYRLALAQEVVVKHHHRSTFKELYTPDEIASMQRDAWERLKK